MSIIDEHLNTGSIILSITGSESLHNHSYDYEQNDAYMITWYAMSKITKCPFLRQILDIAAHCSGLGSTPVGLCAEA